MRILCISGHAQHGKDTTAQMMQRILRGYGKRVLIIHNADLLKFMCKQLFAWDGVKDERGRTLLQYVGTDVVRAQQPDFWAEYIANVLKMFDHNWEYAMIPDCRFPNEIDLLREYGFDVVHMMIDRPGFDNGLTEEQKAHPSETALDDRAPDCTICNDGSLVDLFSKVLTYVVNNLVDEEECGEERILIAKE